MIVRHATSTSGSILLFASTLLFHWTSTKHWKNYCTSSKYSQRKNPIIQYISIKSSAIKNIWLLATESESSPWWGKCLLSVFLCSFLAVLTQERERCLHYYSVDYLVTIKDLLERAFMLCCFSVFLSHNRRKSAWNSTLDLSLQRSLASSVFCIILCNDQGHNNDRPTTLDLSGSILDYQGATYFYSERP